MVHKFKNKVDNFLFSEMPIDSMDYERKGGCFVTILKGVILTVFLLIFGFVLGLLVFYTTKHAYEIQSPITVEEFIDKLHDINDNLAQFSVTPKHYRIILNPILNHSENPFSFNGNVWITITPSETNVKTIELDVQNLIIQETDVSVYRSRILSDLDFQLERRKGKRSAKLIEDDSSTEDDQFDILLHSTEMIDSSVELETQKVVSETEEKTYSTLISFTESPEPDGIDALEQSTLSTLEHSTFSTSEESTLFIFEETTLAIVEESTLAIVDESTLAVAEESTVSILEESTLAIVEEFTEGDPHNTSSISDVLMKNDTILVEQNPDEQTELEINSIRFDGDRNKLLINMESALRKGHYYIVKIFFKGKMSSDYGLVYKSYRETDTEENFIAATISEPHYMPSVFPCFNNFVDEVTFVLNLIHHSDYQSVSVSKIIRTETITNNWILDTFQQTSPMTLNNFGFVITNIEPIIITASPNLLLNSYFRSSILPSITFVDSDIPKILNDFEAYTNATYSMDSISFVGVPNFNQNIMEIKNGLVIASELAFVTRDEVDKSNKVTDIAYQIGKLWCKPWKNIQFKDQAWINEALPLQLTIEITDGFLNNVSAQEDMVEKKLESMEKEENLVEFSLKEFDNHRSDKNWIDIGQSKGLFLLDLLRNFLTPPIYRTGIQKFFKSNGSANLLNIFDDLTTAKDIAQLLKMKHEWSTQTGCPLLHVQKNSKNIEIRQSEFGKLSSTQFWTTPIAIEEETVWLKDNPIIIDIEVSNWLVVQGNGYHRTNYDENHWQTILKALRMDHKILSTTDRAILMDDAFNLAKNDYLNYSIVMELLKCWNERETEYLPFKTAFHNLEFVYRNSIEFEPVSGFSNLLRNLTQRAYQNIVQSPLGGISYKLKVLIKKWSCETFALPECVADNKKDFNNLVNNDTLKRSQRSSIDIEQLYCTSLRFSRNYWDLVRFSIDQNTNDDYNKALIYSLGCSFDHRTLNEYFRMLLDKRYNEYAEVILRSMSKNSLGHKFALEFLFTNFQQLYEIHGLRTLKLLLSSIGTDYDYAVFQQFFTKNSSIFSSKDKKTLIEIVITIQNTLNWKSRFAKLSNT